MELVVRDLEHLVSFTDDVLVQYFGATVTHDGSSPVSLVRCALLCAHEGGELIKNAISKRNSSASANSCSKISAADLVTETDVAVEDMIRKKISHSFPNHLFVGEEGTNGTPVSVEERVDKYVWIVDPIDGTTNFVHGFPVVTVSIAVAYGDDLQFGVVYNPLMNEAWFAWKNCGAFMKRMDGKVVPIHTSGCESINRALISTGFCVPVFRRENPNAEEHKQKLASIIHHNMEVLMKQARDIRRIGSAACDLCYVAMGRTDSYFEFGVREWDIAAGLVILVEAGGVYSTIGNSDVKQFNLRGRNLLACSSTSLRKDLTDLLIQEDAVDLMFAIEM